MVVGQVRMVTEQQGVQAENVAKKPVGLGALQEITNVTAGKSKQQVAKFTFSSFVVNRILVVVVSNIHYHLRGQIARLSRGGEISIFTG